MSTLGHQYDNSPVSNAFGFLRLPMNFMPYDSDADWVITGVPFDMATSGRAGGRHGPAAIRQVSTNGVGTQSLPVGLRYARAPERGGLRRSGLCVR